VKQRPQPGHSTVIWPADCAMGGSVARNVPWVTPATGRLRGLPDPATRRSFLGLAAGAGLLCTIGGEEVKLSEPGAAARADAAAARVAKPARLSDTDPVDQLQFPTPQPHPGGKRQEYWIQARTMSRDIAPTRHDDWHNRKIPGPKTFTAFVYQPMQPGFAAPAGPAAMPGPTLRAEVGDVIVVQFRNAETKLRQAVTMHPHGVKYTPDYDGTYLGEHTRIGGFVAPGEEFTHTWECTPDSVGVWPYHDHGPNHTLDTFRALHRRQHGRGDDDAGERLDVRDLRVQWPERLQLGRPEPVPRLDRRGRGHRLGQARPSGPQRHRAARGLQAVRRAAVFVALAGVALLGAAPATAGSNKPRHKKVEVGDNFYAPSKLTVNKRSTITWVWPDEAIDVHDVKLSKGPKGVKKFQSDPASSGFTYKRKLKVPGLYRIVCTLHEEMTMTIRVRH
jgi:plastocyanin